MAPRKPAHADDQIKALSRLDLLSIAYKRSHVKAKTLFNSCKQKIASKKQKVELKVSKAKAFARGKTCLFIERLSGGVNRKFVSFNEIARRSSKDWIRVLNESRSAAGEAFPSGLKVPEFRDRVRVVRGPGTRSRSDTNDEQIVTAKARDWALGSGGRGSGMNGEREAKMKSFATEAKETAERAIEEVKRNIVIAVKTVEEKRGDVGRSLIGANAIIKDAFLVRDKEGKDMSESREQQRIGNKNSRNKSSSSSSSSSNSSTTTATNKNSGKSVLPVAQENNNINSGADIFERTKVIAAELVDTTASRIEDVKENLEIAKKTVVQKVTEMQLKESLEEATQNIARESKKIVTEKVPSTIKTISQEAENITGSALKELNEIDIDALAANAKRTLDGTTKTVETIFRDVERNAKIVSSSGRELVTNLIDPPEKMHRVRKGESLLKIARKYNVSVVDVCRVNELAPTEENPHFVAIKIGQILKVPNPKRMEETPAYETSKIDEHYQGSVNTYYEQRTKPSKKSQNETQSSTSKASNTNDLDSQTSATTTTQTNAQQQLLLRKALSDASTAPTTKENDVKVYGSVALLLSAAALSYLRAGLDDDDSDNDTARR